MSEKECKLKRQELCCRVCLDLPKYPVTIPCGHSFCGSCVERHWDGEHDQRGYSCPQCPETFSPRPALAKNTMLALLIEQLEKLPVDGSYVADGEVSCDVCTGKKLRCQASYGESHLRTYRDAPQLKTQAGGGRSMKTCRTSALSTKNPWPDYVLPQRSPKRLPPVLSGPA